MFAINYTIKVVLTGFCYLHNRKITVCLSVCTLMKTFLGTYCIIQVQLSLQRVQSMDR